MLGIFFLSCYSLKTSLLNIVNSKSQSGNGQYDVIHNEEWYCSCPDFIHRKEKCKHIYAVEFSLKVREQVKQQVIIQPVNISDYIFCHCSVLKKYGTRHNKNGNIQRFLCSNCKRTFSINVGFEKMKQFRNNIKFIDNEFKIGIKSSKPSL